MIELKVDQKLFIQGEFLGVVCDITDSYVRLYNNTNKHYLVYDKNMLTKVLSNPRLGVEIVEERAKSEEIVSKIKTKNLNIYEVFTLLERMPEGTLVEEKVEKMEFKLAKNGNELINNTYGEHIDEFYTLKELLFLTFDLVEESEEDKRKEQEKKRKEISDLEKQIGEIQSKIALLKLEMK